MTKNRYEFVVLFDVESGNPNGDPDAGNPPRIGPESGYGIVTDVCLKRKICNYVEILKEDEPGYRIYIREDVLLSRSDDITCIGLKTDEKGIREPKKKNPQVDQETRDFMCRNFSDTRAFSAVMIALIKAALNCGQMRGPVRLGFTRSIDPIVSQGVTIARMAITTEKDAENKSTEMGRKNVVPYALYRAEGYMSASLAGESADFSEEDLELLRDVIINTFEIDHPTARGEAAVHRLIAFKHGKELGNCPAYKLLDVMEVKKNEKVEYPREYGNYTVTVHRDQMPETAEVSERI